MAKKKLTTGGPRSKRVTEADIQRRREYMSRSERERLWQRRALIAVGVLVAFSLIVLLAALVYENVIRPSQPVSTVNDTEITTEDFQERVRLARWELGSQIRQYYLLTGDVNTVQSAVSQLTSPISMGSTVLDQMEEEILLREEAEARGITVDDDAVEARVDEIMAQIEGLSVPGAATSTPTTIPTETPTPLVSPTPSNTPAPTNTATPLPTTAPVEGAEATEEAGPTLTPTTEPTATIQPTATATLAPDAIQSTLDAAATSYFEDSQEGADVSRDVVRDTFYADALTVALQEEIFAEVPTEELQVNARHILIAFNEAALADSGAAITPPTAEERAAAQEEADDVLAALQNGEPFADLARAVSDDTGSGADGGELGWQSPDNYVAEFADALENAEIGEIVGPVETQYGFHIIQVLGREVRELTPSQLSQRQSQAYTDWLTEIKAAADIERNDDWIERIPEEPTYDQMLGDILPLQ